MTCISTENPGDKLNFVVPANVSGVKINDSTNAASVIAYVDVAASDIAITGNGTVSGTAQDVQLLYDITSACSPIGGEVNTTNVADTGLKIYTNGVSKYETITLSNPTITMIRVYNANGVVIQEWVPEEEVE